MVAERGCAATQNMEAKPDLLRKEELDRKTNHTNVKSGVRSPDGEVQFSVADVSVTVKNCTQRIVCQTADRCWTSPKMVASV